MNWLIKKEIRLLLPSWIAALLLGVVPPWILPPQLGQPLGDLVQILFSLGVLILGITSFGQEFSSGAISNLLAQPLDRHRIWRTKTGTLAVAFLVVCFAACASRIQAGHIFNVGGQNTLDVLALSAVLTFSGGLWTTLLLRQMTGAFWFTLLIPAAIAMVITAALQVSILSENSVDTIIIIVLVAYSIAGFFFARYLFLRTQDIQWTGGQIGFFSRGKSCDSMAIPVTRRPRHWIFSLFWKEIHLHQANLLIAVFLLALNIASACILKVHPQFKNPDITFMLEGIGILWLLMPLVIGSTAIADERRMGVLDSHLCLPVSRRAQLLVKFLVAVVLSLSLGGAMPLLMDRADNLDFWIFVAAVAIFFVSFYASSFARSTVQAIGLAIVICVIFGGLLLLESTPIELQMYFPIATFGLQILTAYLGSAVLLLVFSILIPWNFKWLHENQKLLRRNAISVLSTFIGIFTLSYGIYFRTWELFLPIQPPPGAARISDPSQLRLANGFNTLYFVTPNGRLWTETPGYDEFNYYGETRNVLSQEKSRNEFIGGTNWVNVAADGFQAVGVQSDGSLCSIQRKWSDLQSHWRQTGPFTLAKIGSDTDWSEAAGDENGFLLLKKDGSLWTWGTRGYDWNHQRTIPKKLKLDRAEPPVHINDRETFAEILSSRGQAYARKNDGTVWRWTGWNDTNYVGTLTHDTYLDNQWSNFCVRLDGSGPNGNDYLILGVKTNGTLFMGETTAMRNKSRYKTLQLGQNAKWKTATYGTYSRIWAIRDDGTLWQWGEPWYVLNGRQMKAVQLGNQSNWVALTGTYMAGAALAADGSLWAWGQPSPHIWLMPSRKPIRIGNIFDGTDDDNQPIASINTP